MREDLNKARKEKRLDFSTVRSFNVDEETAKNLKRKDYYNYAQRMVEKLEAEER
jgi:6-phosphogluconolactonase/glucosamine-6-phosphate isomerase/deaminase